MHDTVDFRDKADARDLWYSAWYSTEERGERIDSFNSSADLSAIASLSPLEQKKLQIWRIFHESARRASEGETLDLSEGEESNLSPTYLDSLSPLEKKSVHLWHAFHGRGMTLRGRKKALRSITNGADAKENEARSSEGVKELIVLVQQNLLLPWYYCKLRIETEKARVRLLADNIKMNIRQFIPETQPRPKHQVDLKLNGNIWEGRRRALVESECKRLGITCSEEAMCRCLVCIRESGSHKKIGANLLAVGLTKVRKQDVEIITSRKGTTCLLCRTMACKVHSSKAFRKEGITICSECESHLEFDFNGAVSVAEIQREAQELIKLYERVVFMLRKWSQFIPLACDSLEEGAKQQNQLGVGGSSAGIVSGVLGVAAAVNILTPLGPPLLAASLVVGGGATAIQTGAEARKLKCRPNQSANQMLTLQAIGKMILTHVKSMRDEAVLPYLEYAASREQKVTEAGNGDTDTSGSSKQAEKLLNEIHEGDHNVNGAAIAGTRMSGSATTTATHPLVVSRATGITNASKMSRATSVSRATKVATKGVRFARFAGGALSAAAIALEARELHSSIRQLQKGSPCDKAESLRSLQAGLKDSPTTTYVENMCKAFVKVRSKQISDDSKSHDGSHTSSGSDGSGLELDLAHVEDVIADLEAAHDDEKLVVLSSYVSLRDRVDQIKEWELQKEARTAALRASAYSSTTPKGESHQTMMTASSA